MTITVESFAPIFNAFDNCFFIRRIIKIAEPVKREE
jgi:hypothetical protein